VCWCLGTVTRSCLQLGWFFPFFVFSLVQTRVPVFFFSFSSINTPGRCKSYDIYVIPAPKPQVGLVVGFSVCLFAFYAAGELVCFD